MIIFIFVGGMEGGKQGTLMVNVWQTNFDILK